MENKLLLLGDNRPQDVRWLHSLSEPEIDLLIGLKDIALQRAKVIRHEAIADKLDLKVLRALSYILMQHVKGQISDSQSTTGVDKLKEMLEGGNLLKLDLDDQDGDTNQSLGDETLTTYMEMNKKRRRGTISNKSTDLKRDKKVPELPKTRNKTA